MYLITRLFLLLLLHLPSTPTLPCSLPGSVLRPTSHECLSQLPLRSEQGQESEARSCLLMFSLKISRDSGITSLPLWPFVRVVTASHWAWVLTSSCPAGSLTLMLLSTVVTSVPLSLLKLFNMPSVYGQDSDP